MASPDEDADNNVRCKTEKKAYMPEAKECLLYARDNLPGDVYQEFVKTMTDIRKRCADPDGEVRSICTETCTKTAMKLFQGCPPVRQGFLNFTQGRSPFDCDGNVYGDVCADVDINAQIESPLEFLWRVKTWPGISKDAYAAMLQALKNFSRNGRTMNAGDIFHTVKGCMSNFPELLEEFKKYLSPDLEGLLTDEKSSRYLKTGGVGKATLSFTAPDANQSLDGTQIKSTNTRKEGSEEPLFAEEDEEDKVEPLPDWISSRLEENLPPEVNPNNFKRCTPSYYLLPHNCITLQSSYRTKLGRSILNDALISPPSVESLQKTQNDYEKNVIKCEDQMFESDVLLQRFRATADFIANLQDRVGSGLRINEHLTPLHRRCIEKLYNDDPELYDVLKSQTTSAALSILLSRLNRSVENLLEARLCLRKILPPVIADNYYRSLDHHGPSFKQFDAKRMSHKALLAEAKDMKKSRLNAADKYANVAIHKDIHRIISSVHTSGEKLMMTWTKIVHPVLSANYLQSYLEEYVASSETCEHCGISRDFLSSIPDALAPNELSLSPKEGELRKTYHERSPSHHGFHVEIEEGEFIPNAQTIKTDSMFDPGKGPASACCDDAAFDKHPGTHTSTPSRCSHGNEPEKKNEPRQLSKRGTKPRGAKGGTCCSLVVLRRLYEILYKRLQTAIDLCTSDLYTKFKDQLCRLLDRSIDSCKFEDFCLKFLGPKSFELFTLDIVINRVINQLCVISSSDSFVQFLEELLRRPILHKRLSHHQNASSG